MELTLFGKRWNGRAERWVAPGNLFDATRYDVAPIEERLAKPFVIEHHYSGSFPAARFCVGLFRLVPSRLRALVGVAVFSVPMNQKTIPHYAPAPAHAGVELGRFVLLPDVAYNAESYFLARAFRLLREVKRDVRVVLSFADPLERRDPASGDLVKGAHWGTIYQATNAIFAGRSSRHSVLVSPRGTVISPRTLSKVRNQEQGAAYAERAIVAAGALPRTDGESPQEWLARLSTTAGFYRVQHPGNFAYLFGLDRALRDQLALRYPNPYPKRTNASLAS